MGRWRFWGGVGDWDWIGFDTLRYRSLFDRTNVTSRTLVTKNTRHFTHFFTTPPVCVYARKQNGSAAFWVFARGYVCEYRVRYQYSTFVAQDQSRLTAVKSFAHPYRSRL